MKVSAIKNNPNNPRKIRPEALEKLKDSIQRDPEFMVLRPIVVDEAMVVLGGNQRLKAIKALGMKDVPDAWVQKAENLTPEQMRRFVLMDNLQVGEWDADLLKLDFELPELEELGFDLKELGIFDEPAPVGNTDPDEIPEVVTPVSQRGDIWVLDGRHRIMCGDSTSAEDVGRLMGGVQADMVFTDPPYGMNLDANYADIHTSRSTAALGGGKQRSHKNYEKVQGDSGDFDFGCIGNIWELAKECFLWGADYYIDSCPNYGKSGSWVIWNKKPLGNMSDAIGNQFEMCLSKQRHKRIVIDYTYSGVLGMKPNDGKRVHPTQKPVDLVSLMFDRWGNAGDVVVDLFLGSGTTLIAAEKTNRTCYGSEISEAYTDISIMRYCNFTGKDAVRESDGAKWSELNGG